jgi:hypothetical protein
MTTQWTQWESLLTSYPRSEIEMHQSQGLERPRRPAEGEEPGGALGVQSARHAVAPARYFDLVREMKNAYNHRLRL